MSNFISWIQNYCWRLIKLHLSDNFKEKCLCGTAWCSQLWWNMPAVPVLGTWSKEFKVILKYITSSKETLAIWVSVSKNKQKKMVRHCQNLKCLLSILFLPQFVFIFWRKFKILTYFGFWDSVTRRPTLHDSWVLVSPRTLVQARKVERGSVVLIMEYK